MNIVLLGGNGYIGRNVTKNWLKINPKTTFYVISRSGKNQLESPQIKNIKADVTNFDEINKRMPPKINYIIDFIGAPEKDPKKFKEINNLPAEIMLKIAKAYNVEAMGFIGGILGDKAFVQGKKEIEQMLRASGIRLEVVAPTLVYGNGRKDNLVKMVPFLKFMGLFSTKFKPVDVNLVADELISKMVHSNKKNSN